MSAALDMKRSQERKAVQQVSEPGSACGWTEGQEEESPCRRQWCHSRVGEQGWVVSSMCSLTGLWGAEGGG